MRLLLDVQGADDRELLAEFDRMLAALPAHSALALGVRDGQLRWRTHSRGGDSGTASRLALQRCNEGLPTSCRVVMRDGEFSSDAFLDATATLGEADIASVRGTTLRAVASHLKASREQQVAAAVPTPAPRPADSAAAPSAAPAAPTPAATTAGGTPAPARTPVSTPPPAVVAAAPPARPPAVDASASAAEWARAQAALRASPGPASLGDALVVMLGAQAEADVDALRKFGAAMKRLRWISALAMGESRNGMIAYSYTFNWSKEVWAHERALADCARATNSPCVIVFVNGDVRNGELASLAGKISARPQAAVRRAFVESTKQTLARGTGL